jgi:hypothetical protein
MQPPSDTPPTGPSNPPPSAPPRIEPQRFLQLPGAKELLALPSRARFAYIIRSAQRARFVIDKKLVPFFDSLLEGAVFVSLGDFVRANKLEPDLRNMHNASSEGSQVAALFYMFYASAVRYQSVGGIHWKALEAEGFKANDEWVKSDVFFTFVSAIAALATEAKANPFRTPLAPIVVDESWRDFLLLRELAALDGWTNDTLVDADICGPLWTKGPYRTLHLTGPDDINQLGGLTVSIELPDDATDEQLEAAALRVADNLDSMHRALGGSGLQLVRPAEVEETALVATGGSR